MTGSGADALAIAVAKRMADCLGHEIDPTRVDFETSMLGQGGYELDGYPLDSLAIAEVLLALETDTGVELLDSSEIGSGGSLKELSAYIASHGDDVLIASFIETWG